MAEEKDQLVTLATGTTPTACQVEKPILVVNFKNGNGTPPSVPPGFFGADEEETKDQDE